MEDGIFRRAAPRVEVVDTTGAGDAFNAGFLDAWLDGADGERCLYAAIEAGSRSVQAAGGIESLKVAFLGRKSGESAEDVAPGRATGGREGNDCRSSP